MHYKDENEVLEKYWKRYKRIVKNNIFYKIDFGKSGYSKSDILEWNQLKLRNSVAFFPSSFELPDEGVYNGIMIKDWEVNGASMFNKSRRFFDLFTWLRSGKVQASLFYKIINATLFDPTSLYRFKKMILAKTPSKTI